MLLSTPSDATPPIDTTTNANTGEMFGLRKRLVDDFSEYIRSFLKVKDVLIAQYVEEQLDKGALWPDPLLSLNPNFQPGPLVDELVEQGTLRKLCGTIFRRSKSDSNPAGDPLRLFLHQVQAIERARAGRNYVLTTGTGSGKSLSYILPIVNTILSEGSGKGIRAVVVYPMNALANSQLNELEKYLGPREAKPAVTFDRYTGQESLESRERITNSPPDILLTNFMMLELLMSRPYEKRLIDGMSGLRFLVLDELHTYRGRQGADVAMLVRRVRERTGSKTIQCVGTSATMATEGTALQRRQAVAEVATKLFGVPVMPEDVIGETLERWTPEWSGTPEALGAQISLQIGQPVPTEREPFRTHPLTIWIEDTIGLTRDDEDRLIREKPAPLFGKAGIAGRLAGASNIPLEIAEGALQSHLAAGAQVESDPVTGGRPFAFRLHQFLSPGVGVYATLDSPDERVLSLEGQKTAPDDPLKLFFPLAFCRSCGQHYYLVTHKLSGDGAGSALVPRRLSDSSTDEKDADGFLYLPDADGFPDVDALVPEDWLEQIKGGVRTKKTKLKYLPKTIQTEMDGSVGTGQDAWFINAPFCLCVSCREVYNPAEGDIGKLSVLGLQGRSTATTTLSLSTISFLREGTAFKPDARKLLSFTDNRQDASLQAGHLNDLVEVATLRSAIYAAAKAAGPDGLSHDEVTLAVEKQLALEQEEYAAQPSTLPTQKEARRKALRDVLGYRIYRDLRRGWRINAPNLEQVGLLKIDYPDLPVVCEEEVRWDGSHELLVGAEPPVRERICRDLLERMRKRLAINVRYLQADTQEIIRNNSLGLLKEPWGFSEDESRKLDTSSVAWLTPSTSSEERSDLLLTPRSAFAQFLRLQSTWGLPLPQLKQEDLAKLIEDVVHVLTDAALIGATQPNRREIAYQLNAEAFRWIATVPGEEQRRTHNRFFERFYREKAVGLKGMFAREHTAQVPAKQRQEREDDFKIAKLPILFCSPTMELGVDIAALNVVNMRNVPPTPANYAQRSGRAGRSGQQALVYTYCTAGSPHDQYYFRRPEQMVAGAVAPPKLDVANEDLVRAHVHAIWLGQADIDLGSSLADIVLEVTGTDPTLDLRDEIKDRLHNPSIREKARGHARAVLDVIQLELDSTTWYAPKWLDEVIDQIPLSFDRACDRWRNLYRSARTQQAVQNNIVVDSSASEIERKTAARLREEAERQMALLKDASAESMSDFYVYRYLASEGFLPGYNFPRLPLTAYLPGQRGRNDYLSRPRFLAISEFGPSAVVYHEGARYVVDRIMMPAETREDGGRLTTSMVKLCAACGYLHDGPVAQTADVCERCDAELTGESVLNNLFRLEGVNLRRRDRITCDEEERMRLGYELRTGVRYKGKPGEEQCIRADVIGDQDPIATLTYAQAATIWRINVGWNRRKDPSKLGYSLDYEKGRWVKSEPDGTDAMATDDPNPALAQHTQVVVPFVEDRRNALIFEWASLLTPEQHASLQAALKTAIQTVFQLEDSELAAEPLPGPRPKPERRKAILFYEAAEGGAGVLHRLVDDPEVLGKVARAALEICHYNPETLEDKKRSPRASEDCSTACYDCLMSYGNQWDHQRLDRREIVDLLAALRDGRVEASSTSESRAMKLQRLLSQCDSDLERAWLHYLDERNLGLPTYAQHLILECQTRPDFAYVHGASKVAIYVDGPAHDYPARQQRDATQEAALKQKGWRVHRFHHRDEWDVVLGKYPSIYGASK